MWFFDIAQQERGMRRIMAQELARGMGARDDAVDAKYDQIRRALIDEMVRHPSAIDMASHLSFVAMYLERTADHACVIASWTIYRATGERVRIK